MVSALFAGCALMTAVADDLVQRSNDYSAQHLAATLWAFAKLETIARPGMIQACTLIPSIIHPMMPFAADGTNCAAKCGVQGNLALHLIHSKTDIAVISKAPAAHLLTKAVQS